MAHLIDTSTGKAAMAYVSGSATPWHGLGQTVDHNQPVEVWAQAGGLDWEAKRSPVVFNDQNDEWRTWGDKHVIYRSDTGKPLSTVSKAYKCVQPSEVLGFFKELTEKADFHIETVGSLDEGRRIWALARIGENVPIMDDKVAPYAMLATSYDGTMSTVATLTSIRVVCNNTLQAALRNSAGNARVTVNHSAEFDADKVRFELGIALSSWDNFIGNARKLAERKLTDKEIDEFLLDMIEPPYGKTYTTEQVRNSKGYQRIMWLFNGGQLGAGQEAITGTAWGLLQATTQYVDHEHGRLQDNRLNRAWFGPGVTFKNKAMNSLLELV